MGQAEEARKFCLVLHVVGRGVISMLHLVQWTLSISKYH